MLLQGSIFTPMQSSGRVRGRLASLGLDQTKRSTAVAEASRAASELRLAAGMMQRRPEPGLSVDDESAISRDKRGSFAVGVRRVPSEISKGEEWREESVLPRKTGETSKKQ